MGAHERITVTVTTEMAAALRQSVEEGHYVTESEIVRDALNDWARARGHERVKLTQLRDAVREGIESGPGIPADQAFAEVRAAIRAARG